MKTLYHPEREAISLSSVLYALSDPIRLGIVQMLAQAGDRPCGTLGGDVPRPNMSYHFKVLREAGVIRQRCEGTQRINCLRREDLDARFPGLLDAVLRARIASPVRDQMQTQQGETNLAQI
jgi:DNA-binding transcriptional ArsR family regulator